MGNNNVDVGIGESNIDTDNEEGESEDVKPTLDIASVYNNIHSILHFVDKNNPLGPVPVNPAIDQQYENWEYGVQKWNKDTFGLLLGVESDTSDGTEEGGEE